MPRPKKPLIERELTVEAALRIVEEDGLESFTLGRLARRLGVSAPSLYYHFADKDEILTEAARELLAHVDVPPVPEPGEWKAWFQQMCLATYRTVMERPRTAALLVEHFPRSLVFGGHDRASGLLMGAGLPVAEVATVVRGIEKLSFGLIGADAAEHIAGQAESAAASADDWPAYRAALNANLRDPEEMYLETITLLLDGIEARHLA